MPEKSLKSYPSSPLSWLTPGAQPASDQQIDVPLAGLAPGQYIIELTATGDGGDVKELVGFRVTG